MTTEAPPKADKKQADPFAEKFAPVTTQRFWNVVAYGPEKVGKTTGALSAPGPLLLLNAEGVNASHFGRSRNPDVHEVIVPVDGGAIALLEEAYLWLRDTQGGALTQTVALDSLSEIHGAVLRDMAKDPNHPTLPERGDTNTWLERYAMSLRDLPLNVVIVAHETWTKDDVTGVIERSPYTGTSNVAYGKKFTGPFADIVAYLGRSVDEAGAEHYSAQLVDGNGRRAGHRGGALGTFREVNLTEWFAVMNAAPQTEEKK